jgi:hypothetical protein
MATANQPPRTCSVCERAITDSGAETHYLQLEARDETGPTGTVPNYQLCASCWTHLKALCTS